VETRIEFDENGKIARIVPEVRTDAHRLIEECMLAANVCASEFLAEHEHPTLYRVHEPPAPEKVAALREFLAGFGIELPGGDEPSPKDYAKVLEQIQQRPDAPLLQMVMLRSLKQAVYTPENRGHFGLAYERTRISPPPSAAIPTCWCTAASRRCSPVRATSPATGRRSASTAR